MRDRTCHVTSHTFQVLLQNCEKRLLDSSCPSVRTEQLGYQWTDFHEIWYEYFSKICRQKFTFHWNLTWITGTLHEDQYELLIYLAHFLEWETFQTEVVEKIKIYFLFNNFFFFRKSCPLIHIVETYCTAGQAQMTIWRMHAGYLGLQTQSQNM